MRLYRARSASIVDGLRCSVYLGQKAELSPPPMLWTRPLPPSPHFLGLWSSVQPRQD